MKGTDGEGIKYKNQLNITIVSIVTDRIQVS